MTKLESFIAPQGRDDIGSAIARGRDVIKTEAEALNALQECLDESFEEAVRLLIGVEQRVIVSGMGKSGHIARKIAATLASTGTPALYVHPAEAAHGDLGMIMSGDLLLILSNSGATPELQAITQHAVSLGCAIIGIASHRESPLMQVSDVKLVLPEVREACPVNIAPTTSTTLMLAMGDALAVALLDARGFTADDFARSHPAGSLGRRLLLHITDVMHSGEDLPKVPADASLSEALVEMSRKRLGMTAVVDADGVLIGLFTDGDLRRALDSELDVRTARIADVMTRNPRTIGADQLAVEAARQMETQKINGLIVVDGQGRAVGALNIHDLLRARVV